MLKFFRRIRRKLIDRGNLKRYLVYAIGEILLVMIGILLALQVSKWNGNLIDKRAERKALADLSHEFQANKRMFDEHLKYKQTIVEDGMEFIKNIRDTSIPENEKRILRPSVGRRTYNPSMGMINAIMNSDKLDKLENDSLRNWLSNWKDIMLDYQDEVLEQQKFVSNVILPYEASLIPLSIEGHGKYLTDERSIELYRKSNDDMKYQNLLIRNFQIVRVQIEESENVNKGFEVILNLIENEVEKK